MKFKPLGDRVLVKRIAAEAKTAGGIIIPDNAKEKPMEGEVLAVGNGIVLKDGSQRKPDVKVGDRVLFGKYSGSELQGALDDQLILKESDILAVIEK
jgi:chaperonin GroES